MKHFKLIPNTGKAQIGYLMEFNAEKRAQIEKRVGFGKDYQPPYLLIVKTSDENGAESYTDIKPIHHEGDLLRAIGKRVCFDYSGITPTVWKDGKLYSWDDYKELNYKPVNA